jgi:hypothetical protein
MKWLLDQVHRSCDPTTNKHRKVECVRPDFEHALPCKLERLTAVLENPPELANGDSPYKHWAEWFIPRLRPGIHSSDRDEHAEYTHARIVWHHRVPLSLLDRSFVKFTKFVAICGFCPDEGCLKIKILNIG